MMDIAALYSNTAWRDINNYFTCQLAGICIFYMDSDAWNVATCIEYGEDLLCDNNYRIHLFVIAVNRTYEFSGVTDITSFRRYRKHSTGHSTYGLWVRTYSKFVSSKFVLTVRGYKAQSNSTEGSHVAQSRESRLIRPLIRHQVII